MSPTPRPAFALAELIATLAVCALLAAALTVAMDRTRRHAALSDDLANLKQFASATPAYAADNEDKVWTFSWLPNTAYEVVENGVSRTLVTPSDPRGAAAVQAGHILRARGQIAFPDYQFGWTPYIIYSHLVLSDYFDEQLPAPWIISAADANRQDWQTAIRADRSGQLYFQLPNRPPRVGSDFDLQWPFSSSFELGPVFFARDARDGGSTLSQARSYGHYNIGVLPYGGRRLSEVQYPSHKAMLYDTAQRHFGPREVYFAYEEARIPILTTDGAAVVRSTRDANPGFRPNDPSSPLPTTFTYDPSASSLVLTPPRHPDQPETVTGHYRWTRSGLRGRDFGGPEVPWVP